MKYNESALHSHYIIDGILQDTTPADILDECMEFAGNDVPNQESGYDDIIDEITDPPVTSFTYDSSHNEEYARETAALSADRPFTMLYPDHYTRLKVADALISRLWSEGHFRLGDLRLWAQWEWNMRPIGNMAAFYLSASAASDYIEGVGLKLADYLFIESDAGSLVRFYAWLPDEEGNDDEDIREDSLFRSSPFESLHPWIGEGRMCSSTLIPDESSWIIYIPFDTCPYRLGGSLLAQSKGHNGGPGPQIHDPDYFIDCFEVIRELVEDGIVKAGINICDGGLATAAQKMCGDHGMKLDISGLKSSYHEDDTTKILFGEVPGVLIQINNQDYDYLDSQLLLQDVAYYPIGHPDRKTNGICIESPQKNGVADILASLLSQASEGED